LIRQWLPPRRQAYARRTEEHDAEYAGALKTTPTPLRTHSMLACSTRDESKRVQWYARRAHHRRGVGNDERRTRLAITLCGCCRMRMRQLCLSVIRLGAHWADGVADGEKQVKVLGQWVPVKCRIVKNWRFSAHADWEEVGAWLEGSSVAAASRFVTHGEPDAAQAMANHIREIRFG